MPYRIDLDSVAGDTVDRIIDLGAIDVEPVPGGGLAALMPDSVAPEELAAALGLTDVTISPATPRDSGSIWVLHPRAIRIGRVRIVPAGDRPERDAIRLIDGPAFGTGLHATTALCLEALQDIVMRRPTSDVRGSTSSPRPEPVEGRGPKSTSDVGNTRRPKSDVRGPEPTSDSGHRTSDDTSTPWSVPGVTPTAVLDIGTGSGVLALSALVLGVPRALGIDTDEEAVRVAAENARINGLRHRLHLVCGGPEAVTGTWPLILANVLAAPLIDMAPSLVRRIGHQGELVLSGIPASVEDDVDRAYRHLGLLRVRVMSRDGWVALVLRASW